MKKARSWDFNGLLNTVKQKEGSGTSLHVAICEKERKEKTRRCSSTGSASRPSSGSDSTGTSGKINNKIWRGSTPFQTKTFKQQTFVILNLKMDRGLNVLSWGFEPRSFQDIHNILQEPGKSILIHFTKQQSISKILQIARSDSKTNWYLTFLLLLDFLLFAILLWILGFLN